MVIAHKKLSGWILFARSCPESANRKFRREGFHRGRSPERVVDVRHPAFPDVFGTGRQQSAGAEGEETAGHYSPTRQGRSATQKLSGTGARAGEPVSGGREPLPGLQGVRCAKTL